ncbi:hypothetical protein AB833_08710 [Chromatiales bacterium (ex Bugula neritina AB1)]|nr:hypothetical protein AB833_08710 [Chromatiales bacterium (ex Bugula neritina AB1)]
MEESLELQDFTSRRGELSAYGRAVNSAATLRWIIIAVALVVTLLLLALFFLESASASVKIVVFIALVCLLAGLYSIWRYTNQHFIEPDLAFRKWLQQVCDGELSSYIDLPPSHRHFKELNFHTHNLANALRKLSTDMESLVESQTRRLEYQNRVLELLYRLTADLSSETEQQAVLNTVCNYLADWFGDATVAAYMKKSDHLRRTALGQSSVLGDSSETLFSGVLKSTGVFSFSDQMACSELVDDIQHVKPASAGDRHLIRVPVFRGEQVVGVIILEVGNFDASTKGQSDRVLTTVSEQISLFVTKNSALEHVQEARLMQARNNLGAEIHDSLAQTLLATRYHVTMLREAAIGKTDQHLFDDIVRIEGMIGEANEEVRGLIQEYRKPLSSHRGTDSLQTTIDQFRKSSGMQVFFQSDSAPIKFTPREDSVIQRIVGEALINAQKYSNAGMIRVYLRCQPSGVRCLLIEDDGVGFAPEPAGESLSSSTADHIGLSIMHERALSIGAVVAIDSEPGEGTRVSLELPPLIPGEE